MSFFEGIQRAVPSTLAAPGEGTSKTRSSVGDACDVRVTVDGAVLSDVFKGKCMVTGVHTRFAVNEVPSALITVAVIEPHTPTASGRILTELVQKCRVSASTSIQVREVGKTAWIPLFSGVVEQAVCEVLAGSAVVEIKVKHELVHLQSSFSGRSFQSKSDADILKTLLGVAVIQADKSHSLTTKRDQTIHWPFGASVWEFAKALLWRNGVCFWPEVKGGRVAPVGWCKDVVSVLGDKDHVEQLSWKQSALHAPKSVWFEQHDVQKQAGIKVRGESVLPGHGCFDVSTIKPLTSADSHLMDCGWPAPNGGATSKGRANGLILSSEIQAARGTVVLRGCMMGLVGAMLKLEKFEKGLCGEGLITAVEHEFDARLADCRTTFSVGLTAQSASWVEVPAPGGTVVGRVCAYDKTHSRQGWNEVWVDVAGIEGQVRARYSGAYASKSAAMWLYPQTGDEVLLCTMAGDPCSLVMIGAMNNPVNKLPEGWTVIDNDKRGLVFHKGDASLGLKFDQKTQHMEWGGGAGSNLQQITVDAKKGVAFEVKAGEFSVTTAKGGISLSAKEKNVQVRAKSHLTLSGDQGVAVSSDRGAVKMSGKTTMALSAEDVALAAGQSKVDLTQVSISMKATSVTVKGTEGVSFNGGPTSELSLKSVGAVLKGPSVEIDGQGKADVKSPMIALKP